MLIQLTTAGVALIEAASAPVVITSYKLGSAFGYVPSAADTNIHGTLVYTGVPSVPVTVNMDLIKYGIALDYDLPTMTFGEVGYYVGSTLFALGVNSVLLTKQQQVTGTDGTAMRIDAYLSMVGTNYTMWGDVAATSNKWQLATLESVDRLPKSADAVPNFYIIDGADSTQSSFLAFTNREGSWDFDAYAYANSQEVTITARTATSVTIAYSGFNTDMQPSYFGQVFAQFTSGVNYSMCRYVQSVGFSGTVSATFNFQSPMAVLPAIGDKVRIFSRQALSTTSVILPIATASVLGGVKIGNGINVAPDGTISINPSSFPVTSVNDMTGDVTVTANDIPGLANVAKTGSYNDLSNKPLPYTLPIATTTILGGVKAASPSRGVTITGQGVIDLNFDPVKSVNGQFPDPANGNVTLVIPSAPVGLVNPTAIPAAANLNTYTTAGLFFITQANIASIVNAPAGIDVGVGATVEVVPMVGGGSGDNIQRLTNAGAVYWRPLVSSTWGSWVSPVMTVAPIPVATDTVLGGVKIGAGISVTGDGTISADLRTVNNKTPTSGNVTLIAADVGAIPTTEKGAVGGVASLTASPNSPLNPEDSYLYGRLQSYQSPLGGWYNYGTWNANTNAVTDPAGNAYPIVGIANTGKVVIDTNLGVPPQNLVTVSGNGISLRVGTTGTTNIDGITTWAADDILISDGLKWLRIAGTAYVLPISTASVLGGVKIGSGVTVAGDGTISITALNTSVLTAGTLGVARGGTGAGTLTGYVKGNGTSAFTASATIPMGDLTGTLGIGNGGTGATTAAAALTALGGASLTANNTLTGTQTIQATTPTLTMDTTSGTGATALLLSTSGSLRWEITKSGTTDHLDINRYVAGAYTDTPVSIKNNTGVVVINKLTVADVLNPSGGIVGVDYAMEAAAGNIGEFIEASVSAGSPVSLTSGANTTITSITLTPGDWEVYATAGTEPAGSTDQTAFVAGIGTAAATMPGHPAQGGSVLLPFAAATGTGIVTPVGKRRFNLNANTEVYLIMRVTFTGGTNDGYGYIAARRIAK